MLLCPFEIIDDFLRPRGGSRLRVEGEGRFLQIAVWAAVLAASDFSAIRIWRVPGNPHSVQRLGIRRPHVAGSMGDQHGPVRKRRVQQLLIRVNALLQHVVIVAEADHPFALGMLPRRL